MNNYPFESVHQALRWYFNRSWIKPPKGVQSPDFNNIPTGSRRDDPERVLTAFIKIDNVVSKLPAREWVILANEYKQMSRPQMEVATFLGITDRWMRGLREKLIPNIERSLRACGAVQKKR